MSNHYKLISEFYNNIIDESHDEAINLLFNNINIVTSIIDKYINLSENKQYDTTNIIYDLYTIYYYYEISNDVEEILFIESEIIRLGILHICSSEKTMRLNNKDEYNSTEIYDYDVLLAKTPTLIELFILFLIVFNLEAHIYKSKHYVGIDFEFNTRKIALMQTSFERPKQPVSFIWIVNPGEFNEMQTNFMIKYLMTDLKIYKVVHGSDSLDMPYVYQEMLKNDLNKIKLFTTNVVDTRFLCEYFRINVGQEKKCSIYDGLKFFGTISENKYKELEEINEKMQPIQDLQWNVKRMSSFHTLYALYDVLFLKQFLLDIFKKAKTDTADYYASYKYIPIITRFVFIEKKEISDVTNTAKKDTDPMNNYLIRQGANNITLITILNQILDNLIITKIGMNVNNLLGINYTKTTMMTIFKKIVYYLIALNHKIYINKQETYKNTLSIDDMYKKINDLGFKDLVYLLSEFQKEASAKLKVLY
ncbi:MAG: hypothetical protein Edafosvirus12_8 [Edafosvirus sp.]|uniref:Uncharacterized protein n=1 Tax=Edafosvirus sp. TaxID=2487765 RepID=A0A3G4ZYD2_9VIRU|nr:MAG: hypothetical protein Edafosvirus12_8 [Edafosvirus sp.]